MGGGTGRAAMLVAVLVLASASVWAAPDPALTRPVLVIPRVGRPPALEDFLDMKPNGAVEGRWAKVAGFIQQAPSDGEPSTQRTEVYLSYDEKNLYVIFLCFDSEPGKVRARMVRRENLPGEDNVGVMLDTFHDQRRAYFFATNPYGVQLDSIWTEGQGFDDSFDTLWHSYGQLTSQGYVIWMAIPFKSLRFPSKSEQTWGILFQRWVVRDNEQTFWPRVSSRIEGQLNQAAMLRGLQNISPGRSIQLIPFGMFRSFRALDKRDPFAPHFVRDRSDPDAGLDAKVVLKDSLVLDVALNPDFSQVESDEPQVTVNQRFEVFFPEKRPFFLENASFFETPINLLFTRRIADPQLGVRLTGKVGPYAIGAFLADDESPGKTVLPDDPLVGKRAYFGIARVSRDIFQQSTLGFIYTHREFEDSFNRVGGLDGRFKLSGNWVARFQGVASSTRFLDGRRLAGPAYDFQLARSGRQLSYNLEYNDRSPGFRTLPGFLVRSDIRRFGQTVNYRFRPEGKYLISWGPNFSLDRVWDHSGNRLDWTSRNYILWEFTGWTFFGLLYNAGRERLRPQDFPVLPENRDFSHTGKGFFFSSSYIPQVTFQGNYVWGTSINFVPPFGQKPMRANKTSGFFGLTLQPLTPLRIDNTYVLSRLTDRATGTSIFNNHILRSKWNWQFNRELSLRVILQYNAVLANPELTALPTTKNFNADFLFTYLVNPWTALFIGYNGNAQNIELLPTATGSQIVHHRRRFTNDAKQFFIKFSYLLRF
ncbi:MAG: DUF5916 domain-containing protein [Terriglobia bacterium]